MLLCVNRHSLPDGSRQVQILLFLHSGQRALGHLELLFQLLLLLLLLLHEILTALHDHANRIVLRLESFVLGMLGVTLHQLQHRKHIRGNEARQALLRFLVLITALHPCSLFECRRHHGICEKGDGKDSLLRVQLGRLLPLRVAPNPHHQPALPAALTAPPRRPC